MGFTIGESEAGAEGERAKEAGGSLGRDGGVLEDSFERLIACSVVEWIVSSPMVLEHTFSTSTYIDVHTTWYEHKHIIIRFQKPFTKSRSSLYDDGSLVLAFISFDRQNAERKIEVDIT